MPDGEYRLIAAFQNRAGKADDNASVRIESPLRLDWKFPEFYADAGGFFDTFNLRAAVAPGVLSPAQDAALVNVASDFFSGFAVNSIAIQVPA